MRVRVCVWGSVCGSACVTVCVCVWVVRVAGRLCLAACVCVYVCGSAYVCLNAARAVVSIWGGGQPSLNASRRLLGASPMDFWQQVTRGDTANQSVVSIEGDSARANPEPGLKGTQTNTSTEPDICNTRCHIYTRVRHSHGMQQGRSNTSQMHRYAHT